MRYSFWRISRSALLAAGIVLALTAIPGCGGNVAVEGREEVFLASGTVRLDGQPVEGVSVVFRCSAVGRTAAAMTDENGSFELTTFDTGDGAVAGTHTVTLKKVSVVTTQNPAGQQAPPIVEETWHLPHRYADAATSGITAIVQSSGDNEFSFELRD